MKTPPPNPDSRWDGLVRQARSDAAPPVDVAALLRAVRQAGPAPDTGWLADLAALFSARRAWATCLAGSAACALVVAWEIWDSARALPWAQLIDSATGGGS